MGTTIIPEDVHQLEIKGIGINGGVNTVVEDAELGIVTAFVSITGVKDKVNDIIMPGAYANTLKKQSPKGILDHDWKSVVSKPLEIKELLPGDAELPTQFADGTPWPVGAGALRVKAQYNLGSTAGRDAFSNAQFWGDDQEWSIGYTVPAGQATKSNGVRYIKALDLFEYSMVLWGAMPHARTIAVKDMMAGGISALSEDLPDEDATAAFADATKAYMESIEDAFTAGVLDRKSFRQLYAPIATKTAKFIAADTDDEDEDEGEDGPKPKGKRPFKGAAPPFGKKDAIATVISDEDLEAIVAESGLEDEAAVELRKAVQVMVDAEAGEARAEAESALAETLVNIGESSEGAKSLVTVIAGDLIDVFESKGWMLTEEEGGTKSEILRFDASSFDVKALLSSTS